MPFGNGSISLEEVIVEPIRDPLIPAFDDLKAACIDAASLAGGISGYGASVFMLAESESKAHDIAMAMNNIYSLTGISFFNYVSPIRAYGVSRNK
ncbi:MAG: hypothetical protein ACR2IH_03120 [Pyrinomonadaceae bacterium]